MKRPSFDFKKISNVIKGVFKGELHKKRELSIANATLGVINSKSLIIHKVGHGLAAARGLKTKHAIKQVDRLLSNEGIDVYKIAGLLIPAVIGVRKEIVVALDWTDFDSDGHATIALNLTTNHGLATPLIWKTVEKSALKNRRNDYEDELLVRFKEALPEGVHVTLLADRGFGDHKLFDFLENILRFDYVIRIRGNITVTSEAGEKRTASSWVGKKGRKKVLRNAKVTYNLYQVASVVCVQDKDMKEPWCLVASKKKAAGRDLIKYYAKRWAIEPSFRDTKDIRFGMAMKATHIGITDRRDRMFLINAFAIFIMTMLGAASEALGMDKYLKANTVKYRTHSLFRQGCMLMDLIINMPTDALHALMQSFDEIRRQHAHFTEVSFSV